MRAALEIKGHWQPFYLAGVLFILRHVRNVQYLIQRYIESGPKKLQRCFEQQYKIKWKKSTNLMKSANCWHLSHSKMVHNLHVGPFLWILGQIVSETKILKIPRFFQKRKLSKWNQEKMIKMHWNLFQNCIFPKDQMK